MKDIGKSVKVDLLPGILTNHSGRKTVAQILQDADVLEDAIMGVTCHESVQDFKIFNSW
ncbi:21394_t:CDS:2 [Rhizophagus irregularis]|nr:21394_t:CDS:2 [Rhizophagus irregularis]